MLTERLDALKSSPKFKFLQMDLTDMDNLKRLPKSDVIIHAATYSPPRIFLNNPLDTLKLNTTTLFALLEKLSDDGVLLFISTSEVYNGLTKPPFKETDIGTSTTEHPRACYIEAKRCGEAICLSSGKNAKIVRVSLVYGSGARASDSRVLYDFVNQALIDKKIVVKGGADNLRTYCYVEDAIDMMWDVIIKGKEKIYNIGGDSVMTIKEMADVIAKATGVKYSVSSQEEFSGVPSTVQVDMSRYNNEFGEYKYTSFWDGFNRVVDWHKTLNNIK